LPGGLAGVLLDLGERLRRGHLDCERAVDLHVTADRRSGMVKIRRWVKSVRSWVTTWVGILADPLSKAPVQLAPKTPSPEPEKLRTARKLA
jgi:hypothetical protein